MKLKIKKVPVFVKDNIMYISLDHILEKNIKSINVLFNKENIAKNLDCTNEELRVRLRNEVQNKVPLSKKSVKKFLPVIRKVLNKKTRNYKSSIRKYGIPKFILDFIKETTNNSSIVFRRNLSSLIPYFLYSILILDNNKWGIEIINKNRSIEPIGGRERKRKDIILDRDMLLGKEKTVKVKRKPKTKSKERLKWNNRPINKWTANQLTQYIRELYYQTFKMKSLELDFHDNIGGRGGKRRMYVWSRLKHNVIEVFKERNEGMESVKEYVDWLFKKKSKQMHMGVIGMGVICSRVFMDEWFATRRKKNRVIPVEGKWK